jgi:hypothetical protein
MKKSLPYVSAFLVSVPTFGVTLVFVIACRRLLNFDPLSFMWGMIPIGAFGIGLLVGLGYYGGAFRVGIRPTVAVALSVVAITALFQLALYYTDYTSLSDSDGQPLKNLVTFPRFVGWSLSHTKLRILLPNHRVGVLAGDELDVGAVGYLIGGFRVLAQTAGVLLMLVLLIGRPYCGECRRFARRLSSFQIRFAGDLTEIADLRKIAPLSRSYFDRLRALLPGKHAAIELTLFRCPHCEKEGLKERAMLDHQGTLEYEAGTDRLVWTLAGGSIAEDLACLTASREGLR